MKLLGIVLCLFIIENVKAQYQNNVVRLAKIKIDTQQLKKYHTALKKQMKAAISLEPGVLSYTAVADKNDPSTITILEIYADSNAYNSHIRTNHFRAYKTTVKNIVLNLELTDVNIIASAKKN